MNQSEATVTRNSPKRRETNLPAGRNDVRETFPVLFRFNILHDIKPFDGNVREIFFVTFSE